MEGGAYGEKDSEVHFEDLVHVITEANLQTCRLSQQSGVPGEYEA